MSETPLKRPVHRQMIAVLSGLNSTLLARARCYFAGGTRIVLELGEYRESRDVDFLCANQDGYRLLREAISARSLGRISRSKLSLAREVRADQYGIRTFIETAGSKLKFEIAREARIGIEGEDVPGIPVLCLARPYCFAEKFLANADRGLDVSTLSRDIMDLAFMIRGWGRKEASAGLSIARMAYGDAVSRSLAAAVSRIQKDKAYRSRCIEGLAITDTKTMAAGVKALAALA